MSRPGRIACSLVSLLLAVALGCGGSGPPTHKVSGKVTYGGKPLPAGSVQFEPDKSAGNTTGMSATAMIQDGDYATPDGKGVSGGKYLVRINPPPVESGADLSKVIDFPTYQTKVDLPEEATTKDFDVPAKQ